MPLKNYRDLEAWQKGMDLVELIYLLAQRLPGTEKFGLISQMQRSAISIPANIAEGYGRIHRGDYLHHLSFARGSLMELETYLTLAARLKLVQREDVIPAWEMSQRVGQLLTRLIQSLQKTRYPKPETR